MTETEDTWAGQGAGVESGARGGLELCLLCSSVFSGSQHFVTVAFSDALQPRRATPSSVVHGFPFTQSYLFHVPSTKTSKYRFRV